MLNEKPTDKLLNSIVSNSASDLSGKLGEVALDSLLDDGLVKNIPIIGTAISILKAGNDIQAYLFTKKVLSFLSEIETISQEKRRKFVETNSDEDNGFNKVGESLLLVISNANSTDAATYLEKAVKLYILGEITYYILEIYIHIISSLSPYIIAQLHQTYRYSNFMAISGDAMNFLISLGLLNGKISLQKSSELILIPEKNKLGQEFYSHILEAEN